MRKMFSGLFWSHVLHICFWWLFGVYRPWEVSHFSRRETCGMPSKSSLGTSWGPRYDHLCKNVFFAKVALGDNHRLKEREKHYRMVFSKCKRWILVNPMRILWNYDIMTLWYYDHIWNIISYAVLYYTVLYHTVLYDTMIYYTLFYCTI